MNSTQQNSCNTVFPRDIVCLRNISINTLHKGDDDDDNGNSIRITINVENTDRNLFTFAM